jgi:hypothetical protein
VLLMSAACAAAAYFPSCRFPVQARNRILTRFSPSEAAPRSARRLEFTHRLAISPSTAARAFRNCSGVSTSNNCERRHVSGWMPPSRA